MSTTGDPRSGHLCPNCRATGYDQTPCLACAEAIEAGTP